MQICTGGSGRRLRVERTGSMEITQEESMHRLYSDNMRRDLPKLRNAKLTGIPAEYLRYNPHDCYALFHCDSTQKVIIVLKDWETLEAWYVPNLKFDPTVGKVIPHPEIELIKC